MLLLKKIASVAMQITLILILILMFIEYKNHLSDIENLQTQIDGLKVENSMNSEQISKLTEKLNSFKQ